MRFRSFIHLVKSFIRKMGKDKLDVYSAQSAFYLVMGVIPLLLMMLMIIKYTPLTEEMILDALSAILDPSMMQSVESIVGNVYHGSVAFVSIATFSMLWVASKATLGLTNGLNSIHMLRENRNFVVMRLRAMIYTILLVVTFVMAFAVLVGGMHFRKYVLTLLPFLNTHNKFMRFSLGALGFVLVTLIIAMLYVLLPNRRMKFLTQIYGALFSTASWYIFTWFYMIYLKLAKNLSIVYGGLVTVMGALLWLYFCLYLFFFGAEINAWKENPDSFPF